MSDLALLVGINAYPGAGLQGCVNDVIDMAAFLVGQKKFNKGGIHLLTDRRATTSNIYAGLTDLVRLALPGDRVVFHYSGHGAQNETTTPNLEPDGMDEVICPVDFDWTPEHMITDKQFHALFASFKPGVRFYWVSDSCHSGDLTRGLPSVAATRRHDRSKAYPVPECIRYRHEIAKEMGLKAHKPKSSAINKGLVSGVLEVGYISGCKDNQTSADTSFNGRPNGALTGYLLQILKRMPDNTPEVDIVDALNADLTRDQYDQNPQAEGALKHTSFASVAA